MRDEIKTRLQELGEFFAECDKSADDIRDNPAVHDVPAHIRLRGRFVRLKEEWGPA